MNKDPYRVLELPEEATFEQIKDRYRHLSKLLHPDKQPLENYLMAQENFKQIDEAYKSISSPLRRYIYHHFGYAGIRVLEGCPYEFKAYEDANLDSPSIQNQLHQLVYYFLLEQHASIEQDKNRLKTRTILIVFQPLNHINRPPVIEKNQFQFETALPDFHGFTHTLTIVQGTEGLTSTQVKPSMLFNLNSAKRLNQSMMLNFHSLISDDKFSLEGGIDKIINNNFVIHFNPLHLDDGNFGPPQIGADFHRGNFYASGVTDLEHLNLQFGKSPQNKSYNKLIKISFDSQNMLLAPGYEKDILKNLRIFAHLQVQAQQISGNQFGLSFGINYGYRLKLLDEMKLELSSYVGVQSNFQISIITPKYKVAIPIFTKSDTVSFELKKLIAFIAVYLMFEGYHKWKRMGLQNRKREEFQNYNRLSVDKNTLLKLNAQVSVTAKESRERQSKHRGLVIFFAYMGASAAIKNVKKTIQKSFRKGDTISNIEEDTQQKIRKIGQQIKTSVDDFQNQLFDVTDIIQSSVLGAHLMNFRLDKAGVNPCLSQKEPYEVLVTYWMRGEVKTLRQRGQQAINIGQLSQQYHKSWWLSMKAHLQSFLYS